MQQAYPKCSSISRLLHPIVISVIEFFVLVFCLWSWVVQVLLFLQKMNLLSLDLLLLNYTTHFQQNTVQKSPSKLPLLFCKMYKTLCFIKLIHQSCCFDSLRTLWSEALEVQVDIETIRKEVTQNHHRILDEAITLNYHSFFEPAEEDKSETSEIYYSKLLFTLKLDLYPKNNTSGCFPWGEMSL